MAIIAPFRGSTYPFENGEDFSRLVAPPYDVISPEEQDNLYQKDPHNIIRLILGKKKTGDSDWDNKYTRAADYFKRWEMQGTLNRADRPCLYVSAMTYDPRNGEPRKTRWGLIALVRIEEEDSGIILPHERTFSAHRDDRLRLMRACNAQFSQVFALYEDPENMIMGLCQNAMHMEPQVSFDLEDGTSHQMWIIEAPSIARKISQAFQPKRLFIADGHHRYETARNYRNMMRTRFGKKPANRSYEFAMMYLTNMNDEGLTILPSHRLVKNAPGFELKEFLSRIETWFTVEKIPLPSGDPADGSPNFRNALAKAGISNTVIGFYHGGAENGYILSLKNGMRNEMGEDLHPALKELDVLVLSRFLFQKALGFTKAQLDDEKVFQYQSSMRSALSLVHSQAFQMTFLLNPTKMEQVKKIAGLSLVMPRKSTYFFPKVLTGLVLNKIDPYEIIQAP
ncbi:MAG: hypothetical protein B1H13_00565 [Desulfobacteraceae bacterium 4484_190.3]|nr:MAG: hypothetical protein B1H13_00565 [Desulfobacteraceae bacterium 4484_190.3]